MAIGVIAFIFLSYFLVFFPPSIFVVILPLISCIFIRELFRNAEKPFNNIAITILGVIYLALPLALMSAISQFSFTPSEGTYHPFIILGYVFIVWIYDIGGFTFGRRMGKHKLFERISPKKTWEGVIGGAVVALLAAVVYLKIFY